MTTDVDGGQQAVKHQATFANRSTLSISTLLAGQNASKTDPCEAAHRPTMGFCSMS
jgi:hypothetical protein